jgi:hypothetical protein
VELYVDDPKVDWKNKPSLVMSPIKPLLLDWNLVLPSSGVFVYCHLGLVVLKDT